MLTVPSRPRFSSVPADVSTLLKTRPPVFAGIKVYGFYEPTAISDVVQQKGPPCGSPFEYACLQVSD
jgi:hypothetical protein